MNWPPPLRYVVPAIILLAGLLLSTISCFLERRMVRERIYTVMERHVRFVGGQLSSAAEHNLARDDREGLRRQINALDGDPLLKHAFVVNARGRVIMASVPAYEGKLVAQTPAGAVRVAGAGAGAPEPKITFFLEARRLFGTFPFPLRPDGAPGPAGETGRLILDYDLSQPTRRIGEMLAARAISDAAATGLVTLLVWLLFHWTLHRRMQRLLGAADSLARGNLKAAAQLGGNDEMAQLSRAFDQMAAQIAERTEELREANEKMRQEITERQFIEEALRNSERRFRSIWENSVDAMRLTDSRGTIRAVNPAFCRLAGMPAEDLVQEPYNSVYASRSEKALEHYAERFARRSIDQRQERTVTWVSGKTAHLEMTFSFVEMEGQRPLLLAIFRDATARKREEEQRLALERKLLDAQKLESLGVLAGGIAHDFNNLLTAILGNASLAKLNAAATPEISNHLSNIEKTSLRAAELCKQMLAYSGRGRFTMEHININEMARETSELLEVSISKKAGLKLDLREPLPPILADPAQVRQVLMNLVINASEAIGDISGVIRVKTGAIDAGAAYLAQMHLSDELPEGRYVFLEVADNGCGMSAETQARIFEPFFTTKFTGRGLGLAAVLGIVRGHRGALKLSSEPGKGTTFTAIFPAAAAEPVHPSDEPNGHADWIGEGTILVADDDPNVRAVTARMVQARGFQVLQAVDGKHAVDVFTKNHEKIQAVLLDMTMPELNGEEALSVIRRINPGAKVVMVSGYSEEEAICHFNGGGPNGFLQKPFRQEELSEKLQALFMKA